MVKNKNNNGYCLLTVWNSRRKCYVARAPMWKGRKKNPCKTVDDYVRMSELFEKMGGKDAILLGPYPSWRAKNLVKHRLCTHKKTRAKQYLAKRRRGRKREVVRKDDWGSRCRAPNGRWTKKQKCR